MTAVLREWPEKALFASKVCVLAEPLTNRSLI
jgi:hypothetical protein